METYLIHDNGGRPFEVVIQPYRRKRLVSVHVVIDDEAEEYNIEPKKVFIANNVFIGKSTAKGYEHGKMFDGNSILLDMGDNKYVQIGESVCSFKAKSRIVSYASPVGNSDVPHPYAIDVDGNHYLFAEWVVLNGNVIGSKDPYLVYYADKKPDHVSLRHKVLIPRWGGLDDVKVELPSGFKHSIARSYR